MLKSILVPLDGSAFGEWALPAALAIARRTGAELRLVLVHVPWPIFAGQERLAMVEALRRAAEKTAGDYLASVAARALRGSDLAITCTVRTGTNVAEVLLEQASEVGAELIVITTHGHGPLRRLWLGSVTDAVVRQSVLPVLVVQPTDGAQPDLARSQVFRHVLVALDGSSHSEEILDPATELGLLDEVRYTLLQVVGVPLAMGNSWDLLPVGAAADLLGEQRAAAESYLDTTAARLRRSGLDVDTRVVVEPFPAGGILAAAESLQADLIALTTHGQSGLGRLMLGSVADKVLRGASVAVLLYRPRKGDPANRSH